MKARDICEMGVWNPTTDAEDCDNVHSAAVVKAPFPPGDNYSRVSVSCLYHLGLVWVQYNDDLAHDVNCSDPEYCPFSPYGAPIVAGWFMPV